MAKPSVELINGLRDAANAMKKGAHYAWGHHGACNCGHLLQAITRLTEQEILAYAHMGAGEWTEIAAESCSVSGAPLDLLLTKLQNAGLTPVDIHHLEYLDDKAVLQQLPGGFRWLKKNRREDVIDYFECFASMLEEGLLAEIILPDNIKASVERKLAPV